MSNTLESISATEATRMRLGFDPVELVAGARAKGLVSGPTLALVTVTKEKTTSPAMRSVSKQRMKLAVEILTIAANEDPALLTDRDHQGALNHATNLVNKL